MTTAELIESLSEMPRDSEVVVVDADDYWNPLTNVEIHGDRVVLNIYG